MAVSWMSIAGVLILLTASASAQLEVLYRWKSVDFQFPSYQNREALIRQGLFKPENVALIDTDVYEGSSGQKVFVTAPRLKDGVPATLSTVGRDGRLIPYPEWSWHRQGNCNGITSVFRIQIDDCGRLWVLDTGTVDIFTSQPKQICPPQILLFNVKNDQLLGRYQFPESVIDPTSLLITIAVDTRGHKCQDTFAYIADVVSFKLIVFDANRQRSWRISSNYFYPYPLDGSFNINNVKFDLMDGIFGLAIGPMYNGDRTLYWHALASVRESWVQTSVIRNESLFSDGINGSPRSFRVSLGTRPSQSAAEAMSSSGVLFFGLLSNNSIACWNSRLPFSRENLITIAKDDETLQFASGLHVHDDNIYILTSRLQLTIAGEIPKNEIIYRVVAGKIPRLIAGTSCAKGGNGSNGSYKPFNFGP